jgi:triosephosphate isomerase
VTAANVAEFAAEPDIDGALVGGASLSADSFDALVRSGIAAGIGESTALS